MSSKIGGLRLPESRVEVPATIVVLTPKTGRTHTLVAVHPEGNLKEFEVRVVHWDVAEREHKGVLGIKASDDGDLCVDSVLIGNTWWFVEPT